MPLIYIFTAHNLVGKYCGTLTCYSVTKSSLYVEAATGIKLLAIVRDPYRIGSTVACGIA